MILTHYRGGLRQPAGESGEARVAQSTLLDPTSTWLGGLFSAIVLAISVVVGPASLAHAGSAISAPVWATPEDILRAARNKAGNAGSFLLKEDGAAGYAATPRLEASADVSVTGTLAQTTMTQRYRNAGQKSAAGLFVFSLPRDAKLYRLHVELGERRIVSRMAPRAVAEHGTSWASIPTEMRATDTSAKLLSLPISGVAPGQDIMVRLVYQQRLKKSSGTYTLRLPLESWPRPNVETLIHAARANGGDIDNLTARRPRPAPVSLQVRMDAGARIGKIWSSSHPIVIKKTGRTAALIAPSPIDQHHNGDFSLSWSLQPGDQPDVALFGEKADGAEHVMALVTPPHERDAASAPARDLIFVLDVAQLGSDDLIGQIRSEIRTALAALRPSDRFNLVRIGADTTRLFETPRPANAETLSSAKAMLERKDWPARSGLIPALKKAFRRDKDSDTDRLRQVVVLTSGQIKEASTLFREIAKRRGKARLFVIGVGDMPNEAVLRRAAEIGQGRYLALATAGDVPQLLSGLLVRLRSPLVTDLKASWTLGNTVRNWPDPLPDLYADEPLLISTRIPSPTGTLTIEGRHNGALWKKTVKLSERRKGFGLAPLWAERKIASIEARRFMGQSADIVDRAIENIAMVHQVPSRVTALVAFDGDVAIPVLPFRGPNTILDTMTPERSDTARRQISSAADGRERLAMLDRKRHVVVSETVDNSRWGPSFALLALVFVTTGIVTLGLWAHLRREYASLRRRGRRI